MTWWRHFRGRLPARVPWWAWLVIGGALLWHGPALALDRARIVAFQIRFAAVLLTVDVLFLLRRDRAARNLLASTIRRARRAERAVERQIRELRR